MASGDKKKDEIKASTQQAVNAAKPKNYSDPFGTLKNGTFTPIESQAQQQQRGMLDAGINNAISGINGMSFNVNDYYNNPFYQTTRDLYAAPIQRQYESDSRNLTNSLNARGQIGSSYDAYRNNQLMQNRDNSLNQADQQARLASAQAYQTNYQNALSKLTGLSNERSAALERTYAPAKIATNYQQAISPLQQAQVGAYTNQANQIANVPGAYQNILAGVGAYANYVNANANAIQAIFGKNGVAG
jgi:hypothetical protein